MINCLAEKDGCIPWLQPLIRSHAPRLRPHLLPFLPLLVIQHECLNRTVRLLTILLTVSAVLSLHHSSVDISVGGPAPSIPMVQVDAHNIVPCWVASNKLEYSARTIRSKIQSLLPTYLPNVPPPVAHNPPTPQPLLDVYAPVDWDAGESVFVVNCKF